MINTLLNPPLPTEKDNYLTWNHCPGVGLAIAIAQFAKNCERPLLIMAKDLHEANRLRRELRFFLSNTAITLHTFPDWETLPYDAFSPHEDIISDRLATLAQLPALQDGIVIAAIPTLMHRLIPKHKLAGQAFSINRNDALSFEKMVRELTQAGYTRVEQVRQHGEYSIRGAILDLFAMGTKHPFRIELFDDSVETIRTFDPDTQLSIDPVDSITLLPAHEFPLDENSIREFRQRWRSEFPGNPRECPIYEAVSEGHSIAGIEYYLPLFYDKLDTLFDYLPDNSIIIQTNNVTPIAEQMWQQIQHRHAQLGHDLQRPICTPQQGFINPIELMTAAKSFLQIQIKPQETQATIAFDGRSLPDLTIESRAKEPLHRLKAFIETSENRTLLCAESTGRRETLMESLHATHIKPTICQSWESFLNNDTKLMITIAPLDTGVSLTRSHINVICESDIFGEQVMQRRLRKQRVIDPDTLFKDLTELKIGAPVVHIDHGIGRYLGLQTIDTSGITSEYLTLEYANKDKIYVPISSLHLISRYTGVDEAHVPLQHLGNQKWQKTKAKAAEKIRDVAAELLDIYSKRAATQGFAYPKPNEEYQQFRAAFPFEETPDQTNAIQQVIIDMQRPQSMDRLICGDVGFGKTEVAMQAAFMAVNAGKQVAILTPTTLLTEQHFHNFKDRFSEWPIQIGALSRIQTKKNQDTVLAGLKSGKVDIVIGTHRLLQKDIVFKDLGLLIVDEEHRFGVRQKERIKQLRAQVDILTLTATPIPRTLNLAMTGTRDLSIIATPPAKRLSVKTFVFDRNDNIIREAVSREIQRGGQVYFLHNDVATIQATAEQLQALIPEAKVRFAHGQMRERQLEQVMTDFYHQRFNILVCTTIIESGIDIPSANTILIDQANHFGLAQLHQLRGRVGRSHHQAYAYLLVHDQKVITKDAKKRLEAITMLDELGAGFSLATHDLEIRGAGEILGDEQSGHMQAIGFTLYMELLEKAVTALKAGESPDLTLSKTPTIAEIDFHCSALIPESYIPDVGLRLTLYKRLAHCKTTDEIQQLKAEIIDRFGLLPEPTQTLIFSTELKLVCDKLGIVKIDAQKTKGKIIFNDHPNINPKSIIMLIQQQPDHYQLKGANVLHFTIKADSIEQKVLHIKQLLAKCSS